MRKREKRNLKVVEVERRTQGETKRKKEKKDTGKKKNVGKKEHERKERGGI